MSELREALLAAMDILDPPGNMIGMMASIGLRQRIGEMKERDEIADIEAERDYQSRLDAMEEQ